MLNLSELELRDLKSRYNLKKNNVHHLYGPDSFPITFEEWLNIWVTSGHLDQMGMYSDSYVLARIDTDLPHTADNLHIITKAQQTIDLHRGVSKNRGRSFNNGIKRSEETKAKQRASHKGSKPVKSGTPIQTPDGLFPNIHAAAKHYDVNVTAIHYFKRKYPTEYYYV